MHYAILPQRSVIKISGDDRVPFLQGLVTSDVARLPSYAALLSPQGKFQHDFFMVSSKESILLDVDASRRDDLIKRLGMYKLRSKVTIEAIDMQVAVVWGGKQDAGFTDPRMEELGYRVFGDFDAKTMIKSTPEEYDAMRLTLGVPDGARDMIVDKSILLEFGIDQLHGVDFQKGCYVGQEVTARTKYRAQIKKFVYKVEGDAALPQAGTPIYLGDIAAGEMRSSRGNIGLALLRVEHVENAQKAGQDFQCQMVTLKATLPQWVTNPPKALVAE